MYWAVSAIQRKPSWWNPTSWRAHKLCRLLVQSMAWVTSGTPNKPITSPFESQSRRQLYVSTKRYHNGGMAANDRKRALNQNNASPCDGPSMESASSSAAAHMASASQK